MLVTWRQYFARRKISVQGLVNAYGYDYNAVCAYLEKRGVTSPPRMHPEIVDIFGMPAPEKEDTPAPEASNPPPAPVKKKRQIEVSIKNTKKELISIAASLDIFEVNDRMTKKVILSSLEKSDKIKVLKVQTRKPKLKNK